MKCPNCGCKYITIRQQVGLERLIMRFTDKGKYRCMGCQKTFRAIDRRRTTRGPDDAQSAAHRKN